MVVEEKVEGYSWIRKSAVHCSPWPSSSDTGCKAFRAIAEALAWMTVRHDRDT